MHTRNWFHRRRYSGAVGSLTILSVLSLAAYATWGEDHLSAKGSSSRGSYEAAETPVATDAKKRRERLREGTELEDELGRFSIRGERLIFQSATGNHRLIGLENLNLERISRQLANQFEDMDWAVSGHVTEYRGVNYLLITRAKLKTRLRNEALPK